SSRPFLPLLLKVIVCIPDGTAGGVVFERLSTSGSYRLRLCQKSEVRSQKSNASALPDSPAGSCQGLTARYQTMIRNLQEPANFEAVTTTGLLLERVDEALGGRRGPEARHLIRVDHRPHPRLRRSR